MPNRIFLNELNALERTLAEPEVGKWKTDANFLANFASDIHITGDLDDGHVTSVPSVFARPIQFYQALADEKSPLHRSVMNQWRGLLGVLALRDALSLPVRLVPYEIPQYPRSAKDPLDFKFATVLRSQLPLPADEWSSWTMIYCGDRLVGASSPWSVAYTPAAYSPAPEIRWHAEGRLTDPATVFAAGSSERSALSRWLELLLQKHPWQKPALQIRAIGLVRRLLETWREELGPASAEVSAIDHLDPIPGADGAPFGPFFATLPARGVIAATPSQLKLLGRDVIVLSRKALAGDPWRSARVIGSTTVADLDLSPAGLSSTSGTELRTKTGARISANWILAEETFLSDVLFAIPPSSDAKSLGDGKYALPLTPAFFQYFSVDDVGAPLVSVQEAPLAVTVSLRLPLQGGGTLDVERTYRDTEIVLPPEGAGVPALTVWPGFTDPEWSRNIAIYASIVPSRRGRTVREIQVAPFFSDGSSAQSERPTTAKSILVWNLRRPPLGFSFETVDPQHRRLSAGVIVRSDIDAPPRIQKNIHWQVAVDFGTSNTEIMLKAGERDQKPRPLPLKNWSRLLTDASDTTLPLLRNVTSPEHTVRPPIPTVLKYASRVFSGDPNAEISGVEAHIVVNELADDLSLRYKADFEPFLSTIAAGPDRFVTDVKWGRGNDEDAPLRAYLQALAQLIACEARAAGAGNLEFRWSYPLSLPRRARAAMGNFWSSVRSSLSLSGMEVTASDGLSESEALARCMANSSDILPVRAESLSIAIDIGGGSTDIGFWSRMTLLDRVSIRIAGNDIVRLADPNLADFAYRAANGIPIDRVTAEAFVARPELAWNMMLRQAEENSQGYNPRDPKKHPFLVAMGAQAGNAQWMRCRSAAFLVFAGITYYVGLHARKYAMPVKDIAIYFGGRGSSMLTWIAPERALRDSFTKAFQQGVGAGLQDGDTIPSVSFFGPAFGPVSGSLSLKEEVARGLLDPSESSLSIAASDKDTTIVGEMLWTNHDGVVKQWDDVVTVEQLGDLRPPTNHNSGYLSYLLARVISPAIEELNLDPLLDHISIQSAWLQHNIGIAAEDRVLQPVFAFELRGLLDAYVKAYKT